MPQLHPVRKLVVASDKYDVRVDVQAASWRPGFTEAICFRLRCRFSVSRLHISGKTERLTAILRSSTMAQSITSLTTGPLRRAESTCHEFAERTRSDCERCQAGQHACWQPGTDSILTHVRQHRLFAGERGPATFLYKENEESALAVTALNYRHARVECIETASHAVHAEVDCHAASLARVQRIKRTETLQREKRDPTYIADERPRPLLLPAGRKG